jgi:hypothetical protein
MQRVPFTAVAGKLGAPADLFGLVNWDVFASIYQESKYILLTSWRDGAAAECPGPTSGKFRRRHLRVIRDYGMFDRAEAPQYFPDVSMGAEA